MAENNDRRKHRRVDSRFEIKLGAGVEPSDQVATSGLNISMGGVYCEVPYYVPVMTKLATTLVLPTGSERREEVLETEMIVVWIEPEVEVPDCDAYQLGCAFLPMDEDQRALLGRYIDATTTSAEPSGEPIQ